jgi:L,D-transpeptidase catalytic domain/Putative peptidoglycan binding domain
MTRHRRHARSRTRGSARVTVSIILGLALLGGGVAFAAYRYDAATAHRIMPGVEIAGVDVGGMTRDEAMAAVNEVAQVDLDREIQITARDQSWSVTPEELGASAEVAPLVDQALAVSEGFSWPERVFRRLMDRPVDASFGLRFDRDRGGINDFVNTVAEAVSVDPSNAAVDYVEGELVLQPPEVGWSMPVEEATTAVRQAVRSEAEAVRLPVDKLKPEIAKQDLGYTIVVNLATLELSLYDGLRLDRTYPVAAGSPSYPTPQGEWSIYDKQENPTWVNPAPDGWGAGLPATIQGGPSAPLGTRALYLDAPGIRIHGTPASYSIGTYASHGCIRMYMDDVEELYEIVPIGTTVHIVS